MGLKKPVIQDACVLVIGGHVASISHESEGHASKQNLKIVPFTSTLEQLKTHWKKITAMPRYVACPAGTKGDFRGTCIRAKNTPCENL